MHENKITAVLGSVLRHAGQPWLLPGDDPSPTPTTTGSLGTAYEVTTTDNSGNRVAYDVTLTQVDQHAPLGAHETLNNPADHLAGARFTIKGVTRKASDDANSDASAMGLTHQVLPGRARAHGRHGPYRFDIAGMIRVEVFTAAGQAARYAADSLTELGLGLDAVSVNGASRTTGPGSLRTGTGEMSASKKSKRSGEITRGRITGLMKTRLIVAVAIMAAALAVAACGRGGTTAAVPAATRSAATAASAATPTAQDPNGESCPVPELGANGYCPGDSPQPTTPTAAPVTEVKFVVTGWASSSYGSGLDINYGSDSDSREYQFTGDFSGTWSRTLPFDPNANYYSIDAQLSGGGDITVKIIAIGPSPDTPTTVSHGHAAGGYSIASAQAAPQNTDGTSWSDES